MAGAAPLITKYRPAEWDEMFGHAEMLGALQRRLGEPTCPHAFLFTGPAGTGKTTSARIVAKTVGAETIEMDAATHSSVDDVRKLVETGNHMSMSGNGRRMFIIDECHALSKQAWQGLLKLIEEPPDHLFIALCTTEREKVPPTIVSRCYDVGLRPLAPREIEELLLVVIECEEWKVDNTVLSTVVEMARGSPRLALSILQAVHDCTDKDEVRRIISLQEDSDAVLELCQALVSGKAWGVIQGALAKIEDSDWEAATAQLARYLTAVLLKSDNRDKAASIWRLLDALVWPATTYDRKVQFIAAIGRMMFGQ